MASKEEDAGEKATRFKEKHSLDSDEDDDDNTKYDVLAEDDIEGQEEATIDFDDDIQITPFNMREEMEEGHFDTDGTYIFDKSKEIHDNWIDNIDWVKVKHTKPEDANKKRPFDFSDDSDEESDEEKKKADAIETYEEILKILQEGETVAKAIRRLAKNKSKIPSGSQKWKAKKQKTAGKTTETDEAEIEKAKAEQKQMFRLTELCDRLVQQGLIDIYETPYERIAFTLKQAKEKEKASRLTIAEGMKDDDALDMFADDFDSKQEDKMKGSNEKTPGQKLAKENVEFKKPESPAQLPSSSPLSSRAEPSQTDSSQYLWEFKSENTEDAETKGPFTTSQMITWSEDGTFGAGVFCRKYQTKGQFYSSARLDFELFE